MTGVTQSHFMRLRVRLAVGSAMGRRSGASYHRQIQVAKVRRISVETPICATIEHGLGHIGYWQGRHARYRGRRKNLFDLRCYAVVHNLHVIAR